VKSVSFDLQVIFSFRLPDFPANETLSVNRAFAFLPLLPYFCQTIAGSMRFSSNMIRIYKFAGMLPANFYIPD
jgi:hypothetical protein